jgi:Spy/CpxP family protein refolding chaperone
MRLFGKLALAFGIVALMAAPALAQQGRGGGGMFGGGGGMLLSNKSVQAEIKATEDQVSKLTALGDNMRTKATEAREAAKDLSQEERQAKMRELMTKGQADMDKALGDILKPEQLKRIHEIQVQTAGAMGLTMGRVGDKLKLTDDEKQKIRDLNQEVGQQMREIFSSAQDDREGAMKKMTALRKETLAKALKVLTADQKNAYDELAGKPFEIKMEPPRRN